MWIKHLPEIVFTTFHYICDIAIHRSYPITNLAELARMAVAKTKENEHFSSFIQKQDSKQIDNLVQEINKNITALIDCTQCGNCCKTLMINISEEEANVLSDHLQQNRQAFDSKYVEKGSNGMMIMNQMPCHFLAENKCTVYEHRFAGCREFPAMHLPHFTNRLFTTFMHYDRCPIIFNVIENLKTQLNFSITDSD